MNEPPQSMGKTNAASWCRRDSGWTFNDRPLGGDHAIPAASVLGERQQRHVAGLGIELGQVASPGLSVEYLGHRKARAPAHRRVPGAAVNPMMTVSSSKVHRTEFGQRGTPRQVPSGSASQTRLSCRLRPFDKDTLVHQDRQGRIERRKEFGTFAAGLLLVIRLAIAQSR